MQRTPPHHATGDWLGSPELECVVVEVQRRSVALAHVQADVFGVEDLDHGARRLVHELLRQSEPAVGAFDGQRGDVAVPVVVVLSLLLHLGQDIAAAHTVHTSPYLPHIHTSLYHRDFI